MRGIPTQSLNLTCEPTKTPEEIDIPALREKYRFERDKRLRKEGSRQYVELSDDFASFYETDPHSPPVVRDPIAEEIDVAVLGGGFAGLLTSAWLKRAGVQNLRVIEMGGDFGGVWYWNRYPGISCDNDAYCYLPLLEEVGFIPSKKFADGVEIYEHCRRIGKHFGLYEGALFGTQVRSLRWDEDLKRWRISTNHGDDIRARFVVMAAGSFNKPKLPGIPGIKSFKGRSFHTARWEYDDHWSRGFKTLHGMTSRGFPNLFFTGFTQAGVGANVSAMYEQQAEHIAYMIKEGLAREVQTVEPSQEAQDAWIKTIRDTAVPSEQFLQECTPGFYNNEGGGSGGIRTVFGEPYGPGFYAFEQLIQEWRDQGELKGLVLT